MRTLPGGIGGIEGLEIVKALDFALDQRELCLRSGAAEGVRDRQLVVEHIDRSDEDLHDPAPEGGVLRISGGDRCQSLDQLLPRDDRPLDLLVLDLTHEVSLLGLEVKHAVLRGRRNDPGLDRGHEVFQALLDLGQLRLQRGHDRRRPLLLLIGDNTVRDPCDPLRGEDVLDRPRDHGVLDPRLRDRLLVAGLLPGPVRASVVVIFPAALAGAGPAYHEGAAFAAVEFAGEEIVGHVPPVSRGPSVPGELELHRVEKLPVDDLRHAALDPDVAELVDADVLLVLHDPAEAVLVEGIATDGPEPHLIQTPGDLGLSDAGVILLEDPADDRSRVRICLEAAVGADAITIHPGAVGLAGAGVVLHAAADILGQVRRVVLGRAFQHGLEQDPFRAFWDVLLRIEHGDAGGLQAGLVRGGVVSVTGKTVDLPRDHVLEAAALRVADHPLELRTLIRLAGECVIGILSDDLEALPLRILPALSELLLDRGVFLGMGGVPAIEDGLPGARKTRVDCLLLSCHGTPSSQASPSAGGASFLRFLYFFGRPRLGPASSRSRCSWISLTTCFRAFSRLSKAHRSAKAAYS